MTQQDLFGLGDEEYFHYDDLDLISGLYPNTRIHQLWCSRTQGHCLWSPSMSCYTSTWRCFCSVISSFGTNVTGNLFSDELSVTILNVLKRVLKPNSFTIPHIV